jgi:hypothetical protein
MFLSQPKSQSPTPFQSSFAQSPPKPQLQPQAQSQAQISLTNTTQLD